MKLESMESISSFKFLKHVRLKRDPKNNNIVTDNIRTLSISGPCYYFIAH